MRMLKSRSSRLSALVVLAMAAGAFLVWALPSVAGLKIVSVGSESQVSGGATHWAARNSNDDHCTTSSTFSEVPETRVVFQTTGHHQRALILFQASWETSGANGPPSADLRAVIDGNVVAVGDISDVETVTLEHADVTHGFNWISEELSPGFHQAWIEVQETTSSASACLDERSMIVLSP